MSLDFYLEETQPVSVFDANITHNLNTMASKAGLHDALWRPEKFGPDPEGRDLIDALQTGLAKMIADPERFKKHNPENGWGDYHALVRFATNVLAACEEHPDAKVRVSR